MLEENGPDNDTALTGVPGTRDRYVEQYRARTIGLPAAIGGISKTLLARGADGKEFESALSTYLENLGEIDRDRAEASAP
jgi:hypothetical protein